MSRQTPLKKIYFLHKKLHSFEFPITPGIHRSDIQRLIKHPNKKSIFLTELWGFEFSFAPRDTYERDSTSRQTP